MAQLEKKFSSREKNNITASNRTVSKFKPSWIIYYSYVPFKEIFFFPSEKSRDDKPFYKAKKAKMSVKPKQIKLLVIIGCEPGRRWLLILRNTFSCCRVKSISLSLSLCVLAWRAFYTNSSIDEVFSQTTKALDNLQINLITRIAASRHCNNFHATGTLKLYVEMAMRWILNSKLTTTSPLPHRGIPMRWIFRSVGCNELLPTECLL